MTVSSRRDRIGNAAATFVKAPGFSAADYYDRSRSRTMAVVLASTGIIRKLGVDFTKKRTLHLGPAAFVGDLDAAWITRCCRPGWFDQCNGSSAHAVDLRDQKSLFFDISQRTSCTAN